MCQSGSQVEQDIAGGYVVLTDEQHQMGPLRRECLTMSTMSSGGFFVLSVRMRDVSVSLCGDAFVVLCD